MQAGSFYMETAEFQFLHSKTAFIQTMQKFIEQS